MKKTTFFSLSLVLAGATCAQSLSPVSVGNTHSIFNTPFNKGLSYGVNNISLVSATPSIDKRTSWLNVYPNPATDNLWLTIQLPAEGTATLFLYDHSGKKLAQIPTGNNSTTLTQQLDVSKLPAGIYLLDMVYTPSKGGDPRTTTQKFQVIR